MIVASMSVVTARLVDAPPLRSANDRSRWCTVWSLVERGTYQIDEIRRKPGWDTIDLVRHDGHFYSSKPPLLPFVVAHLYLGIRQSTGWTLTSHTELVTRSILFLINIVPMGLALYAFFGMVRRHCPDRFAQFFLMTAACWGTLLLPFLTVFNNHTIAATAFLFALVLAVGIVVEAKHSPWRFAACGFLAAWGVCNELPAAALGLALFGLLSRASWRKTALCFVPAAVIPIAGFFMTNYQASGSWKPFYLSYGTETYEFVHEGVPSYWMNPKGVDRPRDSTAAYLLHSTIGHHGILSLTPIFLLTLSSWCLPSTWRTGPVRMFHMLSLLLTAYTLAFYLSRTANYNYGGVSVALRWSLWLVPFWLFSMIPAAVAAGSRLWFRVLGPLLLSLSVLSAWYPGNAPWTQPWIFTLMQRAKWIDYSDPPPQFDRKHYSWISEIPKGPIQPDYWVRFVSDEIGGGISSLLLKDGGPLPENRRLIVVEIADREKVEQADYVIDAAAFAQGEPVGKFLLHRGDGSPVTIADRQFFQGTPTPAEYRCLRVRYERTTLRRDAFTCLIGYSAVLADGAPGQSRRYIREIWQCSEVPFGILKWEDRTADGATGSTTSSRAWRPAEVGCVLSRPRESFVPGETTP